MRTARPLLFVAATAGLLATTAVSAFLVSRLFFSDDRSAKAQSTSSGTPTVVEQPPHGNLVKIMEDSKKPRFVGELNGNVFFAVGSPPPLPITPCTGPDDGTVAGPRAGAVAVASPLNFAPGYLPQGYKLTYEEVGICNGAVATVSRSYVGTDPQAPVSIAHFSGPPQFAAVAPVDRLQPTTVAGRAAVVVKPVFDGDTATVFMREEGSNWIVSADLPPAEVLKIAESLR